MIFLIISFLKKKREMENKGKRNNLIQNMNKFDLEKGTIKINNENKKIKKDNGEVEFKRRNPEFNEEKFLNKVRQAFMEAQRAWEKQNLYNVRRYISDGIYQKFNVQIEMMKALEQTNKIEKLNVISLKIDKYEKDGNFDIIHTAVMADITDRFISTKYPELNQSGTERFIEYWSFIRKKNTENFDIYTSKKCPKCGAELSEKMGEVSKCEYCGTFTNTGEYDWVLSEITQVDDYMTGNNLINNSRLKKLSLSNPDFCAQSIEDKAGNGFLQILKSIALDTPQFVKKFVTDELYNKINEFEKGKLYSVLYTNNVTLINSKEEENKNIIAVFIKYSQQRVIAKADYLKKIDYLINSENLILIMEREKNNFIPKGQLYSHSCPNCGAPFEDTVDENCVYCGSIIRSSKYEWIIRDILTLEEYSKTFEAKKEIKIPEEESGFSFEEIVINNILVMAAADNNINSREIEFIRDTAKNLGFNIEKVKTLFELAKQKRLVLRVPSSQDLKIEVFEHMKKVMKSDNDITPEEEDVLTEIRKMYFNY